MTQIGQDIPDRSASGTHRYWAYVYVNLATLMWAGNMTLGRALRGQIGPLTLTAARVLIAGALLLVLFRRLPESDRRVGRDGPLLIGMALTGVVAFPILLYYALKFTTATNAALINGTGPLVTAAMAAVLLAERLRQGQLVGAVLSLIGVALVIGFEAGGILAAGINRGDAIMLVAAALWGLYSILGRVVMRSRSNLSATSFATWFALPPLLIAAAVEWRTAPPALTPAGLAGVLYIGIFAAFFAVILWNEGVRRTGPSGAMAFYNMLPVFGALLGALFLGERLAPLQVAGAGLVVLGGLISALWKAPALPRPEPSTSPR
jgi:drug/metabolite transporter (DMT)-like permease